MRHLMEELGIYTLKDAPVTTHSNTYIMGTSVLAVKFQGGILVASDTQASYGSYAKYKNITRAAQISPNTLLVSSGEYSNFQEVVHMLRLEMNPITEEATVFGPRECFEILRNHMYEKRNRGQPEQNYHVVAGIEEQPREAVPYECDPNGLFLAAIDPLGGFYHANVIATGLGAHIALPILRKGVADGELEEAEARELLMTAMRTLLYRDTRACGAIQISKVTKDGISISDPLELSTDWSVGKL
ncbi:20S proteasome subunit beta 7 [Nematocida homosporus]|uniref:20S proteasome subunit beta 7 n=1 Tax=Nematocida homosporus TaxID=1912981 RepID=UPI002220B5BA|nr:20S proteasome subunit beta 7 [Nematocida homosporus]KAI5184792.1 20S proteasome subunit beta 7 [Nematocida homosporus]